GLSGCQSTRRLLLARSLDLRRLAAATAGNVARRFALAGKGEIAPGYDADLWLVDLTHTDVLRREELLYKNRFSAHKGQPVPGPPLRRPGPRERGRRCGSKRRRRTCLPRACRSRRVPGTARRPA